MLSFKSFVLKNNKFIEKEISNILSIYSKQINNSSRSLLPIFKIFKDANSGGKMLRANLIILGFLLASKQSKIKKELFKIAAAFEIFHTAILIHDDIIDQSPLRRGEPSVYKSLGGDHRSVSHAICLGDLGFYIANKIITDSRFSEDKRIKVLSIFQTMSINTIIGEMLDVELPYLKSPRNLEDVLTIHKLKTADYSISYPLSIGAVLGGADKNLLSQLKIFGQNLGIAYQIEDDILGVFGDEKEIGKSSVSDIEEGKNTLLIVKALESASPQERKLLNSLYGKKNIKKHEVEIIKDIFIRTGALEFSKDYSRELIKSSLKLIPKITTLPLANLLNEVSQSLVNRTK